MKIVPVPRATLGRLPLYLNFLRKLSPEKVPYISATTISKELKLGEVQVRKDLASVSGAGKPRLGYSTEELIQNLEDCLGYNELTDAVLVGAGKLGGALLRYEGFERFGVRIAAAFDKNEQAFNSETKPPIMPMSQFEDFCKKNNIRIGIITVVEESAQEICNQMIRCGITAIWNFAPCKLKVPEGIHVQNENLALSLAHLSNQLSRRKTED
ncbi:MAG: redox-sensing transcriptional repressor Rex [Clostridia bacterium]|nr:redox-sensing transcriptional repressor Rex [Clostridia bacterium]